jgi:hypothetical protein
MAATVLYPNVGCMEGIELIRTALALCKVKLFQNDILPGASTVVADLEEADFDGYTPEVVTALLPAYLDPAGGASAQIGTVQFDHTGGPVANVCYGFWVEAAAGDLWLVGRFEEGIPMGKVGDALPIDVKFNFSN